jgi:hypothetical protein
MTFFFRLFSSLEKKIRNGHIFADLPHPQFDRGSTRLQGLNFSIAVDYT